jgi:threonine/homoserine/homoserine lactone efflux protein
MFAGWARYSSIHPELGFFVLFLILLIGFLFGFVGSIPIAGPIALLVFAFGNDGRFRYGLGVAMGGALAEAGYAFLAFWGMHRIIYTYPKLIPYADGAGGMVLLIVGLMFALKKTVTNDQAEMVSSRAKHGRKRGFILGFLITAFNPTLMATWSTAVTALFSSGIIDGSKAWQGVPFAIGAAIGIVCWFALLLALIYRQRTRFKRATVNAMGRIIGVALIGLGIWFGSRFCDFWWHS